MVLLGAILIFIGAAMIVVGWISSEPPASWFGYFGIAIALLGGYFLSG